MSRFGGANKVIVCDIERAPIWLPRGRLKKYSVEISVVTLLATPSIRTCLSRAGQKKVNATFGFFSS